MCVDNFTQVIEIVLRIGVLQNIFQLLFNLLLYRVPYVVADMRSSVRSLLIGKLLRGLGVTFLEI